MCATQLTGSGESPAAPWPLRSAVSALAGLATLLQNNIPTVKMRDCLACHRHINIGELLECSKCRGNFHYACVGIQSTIFTSKKHELERTWTCPDCLMLSRRRRPKDDNTPVRSQKLPLDDTNTSIDEQLCEGHSALGDTINTNVCCSPSSPHQTSKQSNRGEVTLTLEQIGHLLDEKLSTNTKFLLSEMTALRSTVKTDILTALNEFRLEMTNQTKTLSLEQEKLKSETKELKNKIRKLESEKKLFEQQLTDLQEKITATSSGSPTFSCECEVPRKCVIYGLEEYQYETESELHDRVIDLFGNILNINLTGYIEDIRRLGRKGQRRPLMIELISKKMTKYILQNTRYFRNTGIDVSEYLNKESTQDRIKMVEILREERKQGKHAVIRNNKLYIEGKEYNSQQPSQTTRHSDPRSLETNRSFGEKGPTPRHSNINNSFRK